MAENDHKCIHESKIILLVDHVAEIKSNTKSLIDCIKGNGKPGMTTKLEIQKLTIEKLHERQDLLSAKVARVQERADMCIQNDIAIKRLWQVLAWVGGPTTLAIWGGVIKYMFSGGQ